MPDLPTRLARKWCPWRHGGGAGANPDHGCVCEYLVAAIREALEEAEKVAVSRMHDKIAPRMGAEHEEHIRWQERVLTAKEIAAALAAYQEWA